MCFQVFQPLLTVGLAQVDAVCAGFGRQLAILTGKVRIEIQKRHLFFHCHLLHQVVVDEQMVVFQIARPACLCDHVLVEGDQPLNIDRGMGLALTDQINGLAIGLVKPLVIIITQLVNPQGNIYFAVLLSAQRIQQGVFCPVNGKGLFSVTSKIDSPLEVRLVPQPIPL